MTALSAAQRRERIVALLEAADRPMSATALAGQLSVSRQIIVGDIALLRAGGADIMATPRGYLLSRAARTGVECKVACVHTAGDMGRELQTIVDAGGEVVDVEVEHPVYGQITGALHLKNRYDVQQFVSRCAQARPLSVLTEGIHLHTLSCPDEAAWERVRRELGAAGFLLEE